VGILEVFDGSTSSSLKLKHEPISGVASKERASTNLDNRLTVVSHLWVDDNIELHSFALHDVLKSLEINPKVVGVEDFELSDYCTVIRYFPLCFIESQTRFEVFNML
jgi:hypothetical protein